MRLQDLDLNLLVTLDVLLEEQSVTVTARRMGVTQSAISQALSRLRDQLGDPLLVRVGAKMEPTLRARELQGPLRDALRALHAVASTTVGFDPATSERRFGIAANDLVTTIVLAPGLGSALGVAPGIEVGVRALGGEAARNALRAGDVDLAIGVFTNKDPALLSVPLVSGGDYQTLCRKGHPLSDAADPLAVYCACGHVLVGTQGSGLGVMDRVLAAQGLRRHVALRLPFFLAAPAVLLDSDLLLTLPASAAQQAAQRYPLTVVPTPLPGPGFVIDLCWHRRDDPDPGNRWLREQLLESARSRPH